MQKEKFIRDLIKECVKNFLLKEIYSKEIFSLDDTLRHYFQYGDFEGVKIPKIPDKKLNWLFAQMLELINELKQNKINSSEYLNTSNWGIKPNGNLGIFDIGFGNYFDNFENDPDSLNLNESSEVLDKILSKLNISSAKYIGSGMFGHAHDIGNNKILKITKDKTEAINSQKLIGKELKHIANIYDVKQFKLNDRMFYTIILEKLDISTNLDGLYEELERYFDELRNKHFNPEIIDKIKEKNKVIGEFLSDMIKIGYSETWDKWRDKIMSSNELTDIYDFNDISEIAEWVKGSVTNNHEIDEEPPKWVVEEIKKLIS